MFCRCSDSSEGSRRGCDACAEWQWRPLCNSVGAVTVPWRSTPLYRTSAGFRLTHESDSGRVTPRPNAAECDNSRKSERNQVGKRNKCFGSLQSAVRVGIRLMEAHLAPVHWPCKANRPNRGTSCADVGIITCNTSKSLDHLETAVVPHRLWPRAHVPRKHR